MNIWDLRLGLARGLPLFTVSPALSLVSDPALVIGLFIISFCSLVSYPRKKIPTPRKKFSNRCFFNEARRREEKTVVLFYWEEKMTQTWLSRSKSVFLGIKKRIEQLSFRPSLVTCEAVNSCCCSTFKGNFFILVIRGSCLNEGTFCFHLMSRLRKALGFKILRRLGQYTCYSCWTKCCRSELFLMKLAFL